MYRFVVIERVETRPPNKAVVTLQPLVFAPGIEPPDIVVQSARVARNIKEELRLRDIYEFEQVLNPPICVDRPVKVE